MCNCCEHFRCLYRDKLRDVPNTYWVDKHGAWIDIQELPTPYLINILKLIHRKRIWSNVGWDRCTNLILEAVTRLEKKHDVELLDAVSPPRRDPLTKNSLVVKLYCHPVKRTKTVKQRRTATKAKTSKTTKAKLSKAKRIKQLLLEFNGLY